MEDYKVAKLDDVILEINNKKNEKEDKNKEMEKYEENDITINFIVLVIKVNKNFLFVNYL